MVKQRPTRLRDYPSCQNQAYTPLRSSVESWSALTHEGPTLTARRCTNYPLTNSQRIQAGYLISPGRWGMHGTRNNRA